MNDVADKIFILRVTTFGYDDEYYHVSHVGGGPIAGIFTDRGEALKAWRTLEAEFFKHRSLDSEPSFFELSNEEMRELDELIFARTGTRVATAHGGNSSRICIYQDDLTNLSEEDLFALLEKANALAYVLTEFEIGARFYVRWLNGDQRYDSWDMDEYGYGVGRTLCFATDPEALAENFVSVEDYEERTVQQRGSWSELSATPEVLRSVVAMHPSLRYDDDTQTLSIKLLNGPAIREVNALLKQPIFEIREVNQETLIQLQTAVLSDREAAVED